MGNDCVTSKKGNTVRQLTFKTLLLGILSMCNCSQKHQPEPIIELPSGLRYEILMPASNNAPQAKTGDKVSVHYTGYLEKDGQPDADNIFDSSKRRNQPFAFRINAGMVIKGWDEGVAGMRVGETRRLFIPAHLGYGASGIPGVIPGGATLIFDVELLAVN